MKLILADKRNFKESEYTHAINNASYNGNIEMVKLLLTDERINPASNCNTPIYNACSNGQTEVVALLLADKRVNVQDQNNRAIIAACDKNHTDIVKLLLPHVDLSKINHARIKKIAKKLEPKPSTGWFDALNSVMNEYHIKSISIEKGKACNVIFDS